MTSSKTSRYTPTFLTSNLFSSLQSTHPNTRLFRKINTSVHNYLHLLGWVEAMLGKLSWRSVVVVLLAAFAGYYGGMNARQRRGAAIRKLDCDRQAYFDALGNLNASRLSKSLLQEKLLHLQGRALVIGKGLLEHQVAARSAAPSAHKSETQDLWKISIPLYVLNSKVPCWDEVSTSNRELPIYLFVAGVEGAGHHALETVWQSLKQFYDLHVVTYNPGLHAFAKDREVDRAYQFPTPDFSQYQQQFVKLFQKPNVKGKQLVIDARNSYPEGFGVGALAHPDLVFLSQMDDVIFDLRVLVLWRDPVDCVMSAVRRFRVKEFQYKIPQFQARVVQESLSIINNALHVLPCGKTMVLNYDHFIEAPHAVSLDLAQLIGVQKYHLDQCFTELRKPSPKVYTPDEQAERSELRMFFRNQSILWPLLQNPSRLPRVNVNRPPINPLTQPAELQLKELLNTQEGDSKYLQINIFLHLGFNNVRFIIEMGLLMADALDRMLLVPSNLRMRHCIDESLCSKSSCIFRHDKHWWCPISLFLDANALKQHRAYIVDDVKDFVSKKPTKFIKDAFAKVYSKDSVWLQSLPSYLELCKSDKNRPYFKYYRYHLGCELSYFSIEPHQARCTSTSLHSFSDEFRASEQVLHLDGTPHYIGLTPYFWHTLDEAQEISWIWDDAVINESATIKLARIIARLLIQNTSQKSFICLHLRRGDFVDAGWLGNAADLDYVRAKVSDIMQPGEALYLATDESDRSKLSGLLGLGAQLWEDVLSLLKQSEAELPTMIGFEDYVGVIEQHICGLARRFIGSKCSSFTGGILNIRRRSLGETEYLYF